MASKLQDNRQSRVQQIHDMSEMEINLQRAINDLIDESENSQGIDVQHISMIISHLAMAAASLREKKQKETTRMLWE